MDQIYLGSDMLDHLNAHENVELALEVLGQVTIVHQMDSDLIRQTLSGDSLFGQCLLLH